MRLIASLCLIAVVGCASADDVAAPETTSTTTTMPDLPGGLAATTYQEIVADAADRASVDEGGVELTSIDQQDFPDTALGCPEEGRFYAQVITPGFRVLVSAAGVEYDYRVAESDGTFRLCEVPE